MKEISAKEEKKFRREINSHKKRKKKFIKQEKYERKKPIYYGKETKKKFNLKLGFENFLQKGRWEGELSKFSFFLFFFYQDLHDVFKSSKINNELKMKFH